MAISAAGFGGDGVSGDSRAGERSGLGLLDVVNDGGARGHEARRKDDGGRDYGDGAAAEASAMVGEGEGEALVVNGGVCGDGATTWRSSVASRR